MLRVGVGRSKEFYHDSFVHFVGFTAASGGPGMLSYWPDERLSHRVQPGKVSKASTLCNIGDPHAHSLEGRKAWRPTCSDSGTVGEALSVFAVGGGTVPVYQQILDIVCDEFRGNGLGSVFDGATLYCTGH
jgi:hypothetical protein